MNFFLIFRHLIYKIFYNILFFFIKLDKKNLINSSKFKKFKILIICKGESAKKAKKIIKQEKKVDLIIFVNFKDNDLDDLNILNCIQNIPVIFFGNVTEPIIKLQTLRKLKVFRFYVQRVPIKKVKKMNNKINPKIEDLFQGRSSFKYNSIVSKVYYLPKSFYLFLYKLQKKKLSFSVNSGLSAIYLANKLGAKKILICGLDFYKSQYFNKKLSSNMSRCRKKLMQNNSVNFFNTFKEVVNLKKNIKYYLYSTAKFKINLKNIKIINDKN